MKRFLLCLLFIMAGIVSCHAEGVIGGVGTSWIPGTVVATSPYNNEIGNLPTANMAFYGVARPWHLKDLETTGTIAKWTDLSPRNMPATMAIDAMKPVVTNTDLGISLYFSPGAASGKGFFAPALSGVGDLTIYTKMFINSKNTTGSIFGQANPYGDRWSFNAGSLSTEGAGFYASGVQGMGASSHTATGSWITTAWTGSNINRRWRVFSPSGLIREKTTGYVLTNVATMPIGIGGEAWYASGGFVPTGVNNFYSNNCYLKKVLIYNIEHDESTVISILAELAK